MEFGFAGPTPDPAVQLNKIIMEAAVPKRQRVKPTPLHSGYSPGLRQSLLEMGVIQDLEKVSRPPLRCTGT
jgi:hypothetical protein